MDAVSPASNIDRNKPREEDREPQTTHTAYALYTSPHHPPEVIRLGPVTVLGNGHIMGYFTSTPTSAWGWEWSASLIGELPPPLSRKRPQSRIQIAEADGIDAGCQEATHIAYAINRSPDHPPEWIKIGTVTMLGHGHIIGRFTSVPISAWGFEWLAAPIGEEPPRLTAQEPKKSSQQSRPEPEKPAEKFQPLPGEEDEPQGSFNGGDDAG